MIDTLRHPAPPPEGGIYAIDRDACIECYKCVEACGKLEAIDFSIEDKVTWEEVGTVVVATGYSHFDPSVMTEYGYGRYPNVITAMEMERLNNSAGPTAGSGASSWKRSWVDAVWSPRRPAIPYRGYARYRRIPELVEG